MMVRPFVVVFVWAWLASQAVAQDLADPDRPDVTNGTHTVGAGIVQIEVGGLYIRSGAGQYAWGSPFTARIGLTPWAEFRIGSDGLLAVTDSGVQQIGLGNTQVGAKFRLWANPGGVPVLSILPNITIPTADKEKALGSGDASYAVAVLTGTDMGRRWHVDVNYGMGRIGSGDERPPFAQQLASASLSVAASDNWNPYIETFWFSRQDIDGNSVAAIDGGAIYELGTRTAIDGGIQISRSSGSYQLGAFGGLSMVVGHLGHGIHARQHQPEKRGARKPRASSR
jgi:hypothetical protein